MTLKVISKILILKEYTHFRLKAWLEEINYYSYIYQMLVAFIASQLLLMCQMNKWVYYNGPDTLPNSVEFDMWRKHSAL